MEEVGAITVVKWSPTFPLPVDTGIGVYPAAPVKYGGAGTLHGLMIQNAALAAGIDRRFYITKNDLVIAEHSIRAGDEKRFLALEEPIVASDVFRVRYESDGALATIAPLYVTLAADIAPSNVFRDYGANRATDLATLTESTIGSGDATSTADQLTAAQRTAGFLDGRLLSLAKNAGAAGTTTWHDATAGRTGTNWYIRCAIRRTGVADAAAGQDSYGGLLFMRNGTEAYGMLIQFQNTVSTDHGLYYRTQSALTAIATIATTRAADEVVIMEGLIEDGSFFFSANRGASVIVGRNTTITAAGALGFQAADNTVDSIVNWHWRIANALFMMV